MDGGEQLFNLDKDGQEENDHSDQKAYLEILERWRGILVQRLSTRPEGFSEDGDLITGRPYLPLNEGIWKKEGNIQGSD